MARFLHYDFPCAQRRFPGCCLAFVWSLGLGFGIWAHALSGDSVSTLMRSNLFGTVSIVRLLCVTGLPFLISAFAVLISCRWLIFPVAFFKGVTVSFTAMGFLFSFGSAGWLIRFLLTFADVASLPLLYWFWITCFSGRDRYWAARGMLTAALLLLLGSIDYCLISPFLASLIIL